MNAEPEWVNSDVIEAFHLEQIREHGGLHGIRDQSLLESAIERPRQLWAYSNPDLCDMATAYAFGIANNHPYLDGSKRTAAITCELFLLLNGLEFTVGEVAKYPHFLAVASGDHTQESFAEWLRSATRPIQK
jgi:death-on-curing protein